MPPKPTEKRERSKSPPRDTDKGKSRTAATNKTGPPPAVPAPVVPAWDLQRFSMYGVDENRNSSEYDRKGVEFRFVAGCYMIALKAFRRNDTQSALQKLGENCVDHWTSSEYRVDNPTLDEWQGDKSKINEYVKTFTQGIIHTPPMIVVNPKLEGAYAAHGRILNYDGNFEVFRTRKCFRITLPLKLVQAIKIAYNARNVNAANTEYLQTLQMLLALALWHELTHGFVSFIAGVTIARTPPDCMPNFLQEQTDPMGPKTTVGESGDFMECKIWGGSMQMTEFPSNDPANMTHGTLFAKDNDGAHRAIGIDTIKAFLDKPRVYNLKKDVLAVKSRSPSPELANAPKRRKLTAGTLMDPRNKVVYKAWNLRFHYSPEGIPISIDAEAAVVT